MTITPSLLVFLLVFVRCLGVVSAAPLFGNSQVPAMFKIGLGFYLALIVDSASTMSQLAGRHVAFTPAWFITSLVMESLTGIAIGLIAGFIFAAVQFAGGMLDLQIGYSIASVVNPGFGAPTGLIANFWYTLFALFFLNIGGQYSILLAVLQSYRYVPIGAAVFGGSVADVFLRALVTLFILGVQLAAPITMAVFLSNVALAIASRAVPQMNVFVVGLPVTLLVGIVLLGFLMPEMVSAMRGLVNIMNQQLGSVLAAMGGAPL